MPRPRASNTASDLTGTDTSRRVDRIHLPCADVGARTFPAFDQPHSRARKRAAGCGNESSAVTHSCGGWYPSGDEDEVVS